MSTWPAYLTRIWYEASDLPDPAALACGQYQLTDAGQRSEALGGGRVRMHVFDGGLCSPLGLFQKGRFQCETSFYNLNPMYINMHDGLYQRCFLDIDQQKRDNIIGSYDQIILCASLWDNNYQHFLTETLPLVHYLVNVPAFQDIHFLASNYGHVKELLSFLYPKTKFIYAHANEFVEVGNRFVCIDPACRNFDHLGDLSKNAFRFARGRALSCYGSGRSDASTSAYFGRRTDGRTTGNIRPMANEDEFFSLLERKGIEQKFFDGKTIAEKVQSLEGIDRIISPIGANLMNFIYCRPNTHFIIIEHPNFRGAEWFRHLYEACEIGVSSFKIFSDVNRKSDDAIDINDAFYVDIQKMANTLDSQGF